MLTFILVVTTLVVLPLALGLACAVLWLASLGVRERHLLNNETVAAPRVRPTRIALDAALLAGTACLAFAALESYIHWRAGMGFHGLHCLSGPAHRNAIPILCSLALVAAAVRGALRHVIAWMRRTIVLLRALRRVLPQAAPLHVDASQTLLSTLLADRIRVLILDGTFPAGRPLPAERPLAERFGVSRGSIRDAFRTLETIGLLVTRHGQGTFPQELDVDRLVAPLASVLSYRHDLQDELLDVRRMFEPAVARAAAMRVTDADLADLRRIVDAQRRKLKNGRSALIEDTAFHAALARATRNRVVVSIMATLNDLLVESRKRTLKQKGRPRRSVLGHEAVVQALRRRDPDAAGEAMRAHIDQIADLLQTAHG
jgi:GntR family transcriptional repressor for pyruvate dehydrogenase complex